MEERGELITGWVRNIYPTVRTAVSNVENGSMYVYDEDGVILAAGRIDQCQPEDYQRVTWSCDDPPENVLVLHTLVVHPEHAGRGIGTAFINFYESKARSLGVHSLRIDTNQRNTAARKLYQTLGYRERGVVPCQFNGIDNVYLVCLEKLL